MTTQVLSPLAGVLVAGVFFYAVHEAMSEQTRAMLASLHARAAALRRVDTYDPASAAPRAELPSAYAPHRPTYWEETHERWSVRA